MKFIPDDITTWNIMIIDDEPDNLEVIAETLEFYGATVETFTLAPKAIKVMNSNPPNLILLDLSMPVMDGWTTRTEIRKLPQLDSVPIVALTAHAMAGDKERALEAGFNGYISKPVNIVSIVSDIKNTLEENWTPILS